MFLPLRIYFLFTKERGQSCVQNEAADCVWISQPKRCLVRSEEPEFKPTAATLCDFGQAAEPLWAPVFSFVSQHDDNIIPFSVA